jgi:hypothetical protein
MSSPVAKSFEYSPAQVLAFLLLCDASFAAIYFVCIHVGGPGVHQLFDLDQEANIPAWFSSIRLFSVAGVLALVGPKALARFGVPTYVPLVGAAVFLFLSLDESVQVHERIGRALRGTPYFPRVRNDRGMWVFVYLLAALPFAYVAWRHLPALWRGCRATVIWGALGSGVIVAGAGGVELIADQFLRGYTDARYLYLCSVLAEETLEMVGGSLILFGTLHLALAPSQRERRSPARTTAPLPHGLSPRESVVMSGTSDDRRAPPPGTSSHAGGV